MTHSPETAEALRAAAPYDLLETVRDLLAASHGAVLVDLFLADYGLTALNPLEAADRETVPAGDPPHPVPIHHGPHGRSFGSQEPYAHTDRPGGPVDHYLPVTVRGERLGVLTVRLPADRSTREAAEALMRTADILGHAILVAERDTDLYRRARRTSRLTLAAEMQWHLLPARACSGEEYAIGAQLEPAYAIHGDNYDWAADRDELTLSVTNGMGDGIQASLLTHLAVNALRNARRAGIPLADQAALADQALYEQHRGAAHVSTLLMRFELSTGRTQIVDAGSPQLWRRRQRSVERIEVDAQLPLGMFEETHYVAQELQVLPGDRLLVVSDGVFDATSPRGDLYGERALARAIHATSLLPAANVPRAVLRALAEFREADTIDDALVLCLDWFGRPNAPGR
ncbi:serine/threonine-protein phosphatase [Streptomyces uncialis]|uniref:PP2C family protein-serine/threonine phosphatase n=1 Tax=Streptomyces uncialis TaxID=1048205 RepID=UPI002E377365|nr:PP2C family protein-serine/threonine phosphatase [Streptomyces uncialis]